MSDSQSVEPYDCEIIVVSKNLTEYAEMVESRLKRQGLSVDLLFPNENVPIVEVLQNISSRGVPYAVLITPQNQKERSITVHILYGIPVEHRNMPIVKAINFVETNYQEKIIADKARNCSPVDTKLSSAFQSIPHRTAISEDVPGVNMKHVTEERPVEIGEIDVNKPEPRNKMHKSGAHRKRFRFFADRGFNEEEAILLSVIPWDIPGNPKSKFIRFCERNMINHHILNRYEMSDNTKLTLNRRFLQIYGKEFAARADEQNSRLYSKVRNNRQRGGPIIIRIMPREFPKQLFTMGKMKEIEQEIIQKISELAREEIKPAFNKLDYMSGYMVVSCENRATAEWLKLFERDKIKVVEKEKLNFA